MKIFVFRIALGIFVLSLSGSIEAQIPNKSARWFETVRIDDESFVRLRLAERANVNAMLERADRTLPALGPQSSANPDAVGSRAVTLSLGSVDEPKYEVKDVLSITVSKVTPWLQQYLQLKNPDRAMTVKFVLQVAATGNEDFPLVRSSDFALSYELNGKQKKVDCLALGINGVLWDPKNPESDLALAKSRGQPIEMNMNMKLKKELLVMFLLVDDVSAATLKHKRPGRMVTDIKTVTLEKPVVKPTP